MVDSLKLLESKYGKNNQNNNVLKNTRLLTIGNRNSFNLDAAIIKWTHLGIISSNKKLNNLEQQDEFFDIRFFKLEIKEKELEKIKL